MSTFFPPLPFLRTQWSFLLFGFLLAFFSSPGQTFFISLFSGVVRDELALSHGEFGSIYAIGTIASALFLIPAGRLVDTMRLRSISLLVVVGLGIAALAFSLAFSLATLAFGIFCLRFTGQGMMTLLYSTAMTRRYIAERGRALAVAALGQPVSEFTMPFFALFMLVLLDWRQIWQATAIIAVIVMVPAAVFCTRRLSGQDGEGLEGVATGRDGQHWTRREMLLHWRFWMLCGIVIAPGFSATGLLFHQIHIAETKGVPLALWISGYGFYAVTSVLGAFIGGALVDRFSASRISPLVVAGFAVSPLLLFLVSSGWAIYVFFTVFGLFMGMIHTVVHPLWAEVYGTRHLGGIKSIAQALGVFSTALSPVLLGLMIDAGSGLPALMLVLGLVPVVAGAMGFAALNSR